MALADIAASFEDGLNRRGVVKKRAQGWRPRVIAYPGYGSVTSLHVLGRVIMADPDDADDTGELADDGRLTFQQSPLELALDAQRGWRNFFTTQVAHLPITVHAGNTTLRTTTDRNGYLDLLVRDHGLPPGWNEITIEAKAARPVRARVLIVGPHVRHGVVSDVDDTVMITWLPRAFLAAWNTFVRHTRTRQPVPGMVELYRLLRERDPEIPFFYLSTGAWNIAPVLRRFLSRHGFPHGPFLLTDWGPTQTGLFRSGMEHKKVQLRNLAMTFPQMNWLLIGDDGQHDPIIYDEFAREHPTHVAAIALRELTPAEQVLSHGTTEALAEPGRIRNAEAEHGVPVVRGPDGYALAADLPTVLDRRRHEMAADKIHEIEAARRRTPAVAVAHASKSTAASIAADIARASAATAAEVGQDLATPLEPVDDDDPFGDAGGPSRFATPEVATPEGAAPEVAADDVATGRPRGRHRAPDPADVHTGGGPEAR